MSLVELTGAVDPTRLPNASRARNRLVCWEEPGVLHVDGSIDVTTELEFISALVHCETDPCVHALDLSAVEFFSSVGVRCFVERGWTIRPHVTIIASRITRRVLSMCEMVYLLDQHGWRDE